MKNILIFPAGSEIANEIFSALKYSKFVKLYGGTSICDHAEFMFENVIYGFPFISDDNFLNYLNEKIKEYGIDCIYPAHDSVCCFLSQHQREINAQVIVSDYRTTSLCRSKRRTYEYFKGEYFIPKIFRSAEEVESYPVFIKPEIGEGSKGAQIIYSFSDLNYVLKKDPNLLILEFLPGKEYTVDCFTNRKGELLSISARTRERIKSGISVRSRSINCDKTISTIAKIINDKLSFRGAWFFQLRKSINNEYKLLEISPRIPGTMGLSRNLGINYPLLTLFDFWDMDVTIQKANYDIVVDRALSSSYKVDISFQHIYLDYDDTLVINGKVNTFLMMYLYQCINHNKKIHLISKHEGDIYLDMQGKKISPIIFDEICILKKYEEKAEYIKEKDSIFIDDSFAERQKVVKRLNIPVYDLDMIESLYDWRM